MNSPDLIATGKQWQQAGDLARAEAAYREALALAPGDAEAWYLLGCVTKPQGNYGDALAAFRQTVAIDPNHAQAHNMLGIALLELGQLADAEAAFASALRARPEFAIAYNNLGNVQLALGRSEEALASYQQAVRLNPEFAEAHGNLGNVLRELGRFDEALASCQLALRLKPTFAIGHNHLGAVHSALRQWEHAAGCFRQALSLNPRYLEPRVNLGDALREMGRLDEAQTNLQEAARQWPDSPDVHVGLSLVSLQKNDAAAAETAAREALRVKPDAVTAHLALGMACQLQGRPHEAEQCYNRAVELDPSSPEAHKNRGIARLQLGDFAHGWDDYEWRWKCPELLGRRLSQPLWDGSPLEGKSILLHAEQGLGDTLQFVRYAPLVHDCGGRVILACQPALVSLFRSCKGVDELVELGQPTSAFDVHAPLMSLPRIFHTSLETIPAEVPYLRADAERVSAWRDELQSVGGCKVGIVWQGSVEFRFDKLRSLPLAAFAPLADVPGVTLFSLQKNFGREQIAQVEFGSRIVDLSPRLETFDDTAAAIQNLDLVVTCDTSVAHLAGALGANVWVALPFNADWRWLREREDSPWYPTMRLFRQRRRGDWQQVCSRIAAALAERLGVPRRARSVTIEVAPGELLDRIAVREIKSQRTTDAAELLEVRGELAALIAARDRSLDNSPALGELAAELKRVHERLWDIEDEIRMCEKQGAFGARFVELARAAYQQNARRAALKRQINELLGSRLVEEKPYASCSASRPSMDAG
jgi:tetratricopeptide (TPR) repeat protein